MYCSPATGRGKDSRQLYSIPDITSFILVYQRDNHIRIYLLSYALYFVADGHYPCAAVIRQCYRRRLSAVWVICQIGYAEMSLVGDIAAVYCFKVVQVKFLIKSTVFHCDYLHHIFSGVPLAVIL